MALLSPRHLPSSSGIHCEPVGQVLVKISSDLKEPHKAMKGLCLVGSRIVPLREFNRCRVYPFSYFINPG